MPEQNDGDARQADELNDPNNPPQSMLSSDTRRAAVISYLGPVVALFMVMGIALIYWANRGPIEPDDAAREPDAIGTTGRPDPGGHDPDPRFEETKEELAYRGGADADAPLTKIAQLARGTSGRRVSLKNIEVSAVDDNVLWLHDGNTRVAATIPAGSPKLAEGSHVTVDGVTETDASGNVRIRASRIAAN